MSIQRHEEKSTPVRRRERELALAPLFMFSLPGPVLCKLGQPGVLFVLPEVLTLVLEPSCVLFFPFLVFFFFFTVKQYIHLAKVTKRISKVNIEQITSEVKKFVF